MTYYAGDDGTWTVPVVDSNGGDLQVATDVIITNSAGETHEVTAAWDSAVAPWPAQEGATFRNLAVPLTSLPAGLWSVRLAVTGDGDPFLGNVAIQ